MRASGAVGLCLIGAATLSGAQARGETPSAASLTKIFVIEPEQSNQSFMCENGRIQSVLAFSIGEHRMVSIIFLDKTGAAIPEGVWSEAFGFRLLHRQTVKIEAEMICGGG